VVEVEVSMNDPIYHCEVARHGARSLRVSTAEDIVAEKLRALLQQPGRNRRRRQDVLDIAVVLADGPELDLAVVREALLVKARARGIEPTPALFLAPEIRERASTDYGALNPTTRRRFIPFDEAWAAVLELVAALGLQ
jgi:predicted nucleotidyltransferase component of viral defense system